MIERAIVRILSKSNVPVGVGFCIDNEHILTCAHVVASALGLPLNAPKPVEPVLFDFPLLDAHSKKQRFTGEVVIWKAYGATGVGSDIACIKSNNRFPPAVQSATLKVKASLWEQEFRAFGVPDHYDEGIWAEGKILGRQSNGYFQVESIRTTSYKIQPGFSGSPVWSEQLQGVVAMLALADIAQNTYTAFAIPSRILLDAIKSIAQPDAIQSHGASSLSELLGLHDTALNSLASNYYQVAQRPQADVQDLLTAALICLWNRQYVTAHQFLERLLQQNLFHDYAHYVMALTLLEGKPVEHLQNIQLARKIHEHLQRADSNKIEARLLHYYLKSHYFRRNGFTAFSGDIDKDADEIKKQTKNLKELQALSHVLPSITHLTLWNALSNYTSPK